MEENKEIIYPAELADKVIALGALMIEGGYEAETYNEYEMSLIDAILQPYRLTYELRANGIMFISGVTKDVVFDYYRFVDEVWSSNTGKTYTKAVSETCLASDKGATCRVRYIEHPIYTAIPNSLIEVINILHKQFYGEDKQIGNK